jgi:hypothetical protein
MQAEKKQLADQYALLDLKQKLLAEQYSMGHASSAHASAGTRLLLLLLQEHVCRTSLNRH